MPTIPEDVRRKIEADLLAEMGLHPGSATLQIDDNGQPSLVPTGATDRGAGRAFFHAAGQRAAQSVATVPAGIAAAAAAGPVIHPLAAGASAAATPLAGTAVELLGNAGAFTAGQMAAQAALDKSGGSDWILKQLGDTRDQVALDKAAHPVATAGGDFLGSLATFQFHNPVKLGRNLTTLVRALMSGTAVPAASKAAAQTLANNVLGNVGVTTAMQLGQDGELHGGELARAAVEGALLGKPRAGVQALGRAASQPAHRLFGAPLAEPGGPLFTQKAAPVSSPAEGGAPTTATWVEDTTPAPRPTAGAPVGFGAASPARPTTAPQPRDLGLFAPPPDTRPGPPERRYGDAPELYDLPPIPPQYRRLGVRPVPIPRTEAAPSVTVEDRIRQSIAAGKAGQPTVPRFTTAEPEAPSDLSPEGQRLRAVATEQAIRDATGQPIGTEGLVRPTVERSTTPATDESVEWLRMRGEKPKPYFMEQLPTDASKAAGRFEGEDFSGFDPETMTLDQWRAARKARSFRPAADAPTPEPAPVLDEAVRAAADPTTTKAAALVPEGSPVPPSVEPALHYGDGGFARDTVLRRMDAGRSTGHFGTGTYFLGKPNKGGAGDVRTDRPAMQLDLTGLNLAKPTDAVGLHEGLRAFNRAVLKGESVDFTQPANSFQRASFNTWINIRKGPTQERIQAAMQKVAQLFAAKQNDGLRTPSTYLMQELGYDGIDARGTNGDNTDLGSVIYPDAAGNPRGTRRQELQPVPVPQGTLLVNPAKVPPGEPVLTPDGQVRGTLLGLSQESKPAQPGAAVVTDKPGAPAVLTEVTDGTPAANAAAAAAQRRAVPGGRQRVTTPDEVVATRAAALRPATAPENSGLLQGQPPGNQNTQSAAEPPARTGVYPSERGGVNPTPAAQAPAEAGAGAPKLHPVLEAMVQREQASKTPVGAGGAAGLGDAAGFEPVPLSIVDRAHKMSPATGKALADYHSATQAIYGRHFNVLLDQLRAFPREVVNAAIGKRLDAYKTKRPPVFTPDEARINDMYDRVMKASAAEATASGYPIKPEDWYVPQIFNETVARRYETEGAAFLAREMPKFHAHNAAIDPAYNPAEGEQYAADYLSGVAKSPNSLGSDFGALTKYKRQYHLPPEWIEPDFQRGLQRYGQRFAGQVAYKQFIEPNAEAMANLYGDRGNAVTPQMQNARAGVEGVLFNAGRGSSGLSQNTKDLLSAGQQTIYSGAMQTATGVANTVQKTALHLGMAAQTEGGFQNLVEATHKTAIEWETQRVKAIQSGLVRPGHDPSIIVEDAGPTMATARTMRNVAQTARKYTGAEFLETMNRVHDFTVGEGLAEINLRLLAKGDQSAVRFINRFGAGVTQQMAHGEKVMRMARNYAEAMQSSYSMVGLPAPMLKGGVVGQLTRIQRFGWENMMRTHQYVLKPAIYKGEYGPLLAYLFGAAVTAPVLAKIREAFSGRPSGIPTEEEIAAGKHPAAVEHILDVMQAAQLSGAFGLAGSTAGAVASNVRGGRQSIAGDPAVAFGVAFINNAGHAAEAVRQGEPGALVLAELAKRVFVDNIQVLRRFGTDEGEAEDRRNKAVFEYLNDQRDIPVGDMLNNLVFGGITPGRTPQISPTKEAARAGDRAALQRLTPEQRTALDNYPGGYEDADKEASYQQWLRQTQPPEKLADYQRRRAAWKSRPAASRP